VINTPLSAADYQAGYEAARAGRLPERFWTEMYLQTVYDESVAPAGKHTMSVFAQCVPYAFAEGDWETRRAEAGQVALDTIAHFTTDFPESVLAMEVLGPPDIEKRVGLTGGHIFQGECLPEYMWDKRLAHRTPMEGVYLCGACTHPGGGVVGLNGRNAAMEILNSP
jgi:phytoene dehydrogenase-like protein